MNYLNLLKSYRSRLLWALFGFLLIIQFFIMNIETKPYQESKQNLAGVDTLVPLGFQLIPIRISNQDELSSLIDDYAIVDIFAVGKKEALLSAVRLIRSPNNPSVFAVLVEQFRSSILLSEDQIFYVALRNPKQFAENQPKVRRRIFLEE